MTASSSSSSAPTNGTGASSAGAPFTSLFVHTHDVSRSLKPSADGELAHALHQTLHFALDGDQDDWGMHTLGHSGGCDPLATMPSTSDSTHTNDHPLPPSNDAAFSSSPISEGETNGHPRARPGFFPTADPARPFISYLWDQRRSTLTLPNPSTINNPVADPCSPDLRSAYEITGKFFYLSENTSPHGGDRFPPEWIDDAFRRLTKTTGLITLDTFIVTFPTLDLDGLRSRALQRTHSQPGQPSGTCLPCTSGCGNGEANGSTPSFGGDEEVSEDQKSSLRDVARVWQSISQNPQFLSLGLSDFSQPTLAHLFSILSPPLPPLTPSHYQDSATANDASVPMAGAVAPPMQPTLSKDKATVLAPYSIPSASRRPRVVTINVKSDPCGFDRSLSAYCEREGMLLIAHSDRRDPLPARTLPTLLKEFQDALPHPLPRRDAVLKPKWVLKYTTLIRDRGVLADKGYILFAER